MQYEQAPPPDNQRGRGGDQGCLMGCIAALCCCCAIEEGCECWYVAFQSQTLPPFLEPLPRGLVCVSCLRQSLMPCQYRSLRMLLLNYYQSTISDNHEKERESKCPQRGVDGTEEDRKENQGNTKFPLFLVLLFAIWLRLGWER